MDDIQARRIIVARGQHILVANPVGGCRRHGADPFDERSWLERTNDLGTSVGLKRVAAAGSVVQRAAEWAPPLMLYSLPPSSHHHAPVERSPAWSPTALIRRRLPGAVRKRHPVIAAIWTRSSASRTRSCGAWRRAFA